MAPVALPPRPCACRSSPGASLGLARLGARQSMNFRPCALEQRERSTAAPGRRNPPRAVEQGASSCGKTGRRLPSAVRIVRPTPPPSRFWIPNRATCRTTSGGSTPAASWRYEPRIRGVLVVGCAPRERPHDCRAAARFSRQMPPEAPPLFRDWSLIRPYTTFMWRWTKTTMRSNMSPVLERSGECPACRSASIYSSAISPPAFR
jgi:hypothetical protein